MKIAHLFLSIPGVAIKGMDSYTIEIEWRTYALVNETSLIEKMACRLAGAKLLSKPML